MTEFGFLELPYKIKITTPQFRPIYHVNDEQRLLTILSEASRDDVYEFRMEQQGLTQKDLEPYIGSSGRVSEVLTINADPACKW